MPDEHQTTRDPAEVFHPSVFMLDEMEARGWTRADLARKMPGDFTVNLCSIDLYFDVGPNEPGLLLGDGEDFGQAFDVPGEYFRNLEAVWLRGVKRT